MTLFGEVLRELTQRAKVTGPDSTGHYLTFCPYHNDKEHPNLSFHPEKGFHCFACDAKGGIRELAIKLGISTNGNQFTASEATEKLIKERCLTMQTLTHFGIEADTEKQAWRYPVRGGYRYKSYYRSAENKYWHDKGIKNQLYGLEDVSNSTNKIWFINGEPAVWQCYQAGVPTICTIYGEGKLPNDITKQLKDKGVQKINLCPDLDETGQKAVRVVWAKLQHDFNISVHILPEELGKGADVGDLFVSYAGDSSKFREALQSLPLADTQDWDEALGTESEEVDHIRIDGVTYYQRENRIFSSHPSKKEDAPPIITTLANFAIEPRLRLEMVDEDEGLDCLLKTDKAEYPVIFKKGDFNSKRQLLAALPRVDLQFYGTDKDTQPILTLLNKGDLPKRKGTTVLGRNGDLWVLRDKVVSNNGIVDDPDIMYLPSGIDLERRVRYSLPHNDNSAEIVKQLVTLNEQAAILPILGWFFATPFAPLIRELLQHFPLLSTWGTHGGGKSSLLELLSEIFGLTPELHSSIGTKFTFLRLFSATDSIPIVLDEFKPYSMEHTDVIRLTNLLRRAYGGEIEDRGRPDLRTFGYRIKAPIAVAGEAALTSIDSAFVERCIQTNLNPDNLTGDSPYVIALRKLKAMDKRGFAFSYIKWCLNTDLETLMDEAEIYLPEDLKRANERVRDNILVMITGLLALEYFSGHDELIDKKGIDAAIKNERAELLGEKGYPDIAFTTFLEELATLAQTNRIKSAIHYMAAENNTRLYIHLEDCLAEFRKFVRETGARVEVLDKKAYRQQAKEMQGKGYVINEEKQKWFPSLGEKAEGKNRKCIEIDIEKLPFDASGFQRAVGVDIKA